MYWACSKQPSTWRFGSKQRHRSGFQLPAKSCHRSNGSGSRQPTSSSANADGIIRWKSGWACQWTSETAADHFSCHVITGHCSKTMCLRLPSMSSNCRHYSFSISLYSIYFNNFQHLTTTINIEMWDTWKLRRKHNLIQILETPLFSIFYIDDIPLCT